MREAFERAIKDNPMDRDTRLVFADWLEENGFDDEAAVQRAWTAERHREAEAYLEHFAEECSGGHDREVVTTVDDLLEIGNIILDAKKPKWKFHDMIHLNHDTPDVAYGEGLRKFWESFEVVTGRPVPDDRREESFVSCSC
jgi:uncharacterized protein (TIGR02996 family)